MTKKLGIYKCEHCGNIVEVIHRSGAPLVCCGVNMVLLEEKTADATTEKHVPVYEEAENGIKVKVGSVQHPMEDAHFIEWIEVVAGEKSFKKFLNPGEPAEAVFPVKKDEITSIREYCSVHGLWKN
jgi:superoxide reductase